MVIDNDMLGTILRSTAKVDVSAETVSAAAIGQVARGVGHFLGERNLRPDAFGFSLSELADKYH